MSIDAKYLRLTPEEWRQLEQGSQEEYWSCRDAPHNSSTFFDLDGDWQAIHFLLTETVGNIGEAETTPTADQSPLFSVVMGGTNTKFSSTYGSVRYLSPDSVKACRLALGEVSEDMILKRLTPAKFNHHRIHPYSQPDHWDEDELEVLVDVLANLTGFFETAAQQDNIILIDLWLDSDCVQSAY